ncbi:Remorin, C-terminal region [Carex littledalei]|uniref:Remorin, C-terminal region n=1 Tax=Carex littledalei TaxID=544730 RepID=A0A833RHW7_9POAL|nr:Remorin, C-terminal region [Carex littledalei]
MQLSRKRTIMADHLSSSSSNHQPQRRRPRQTIETPDRKFLEEQIHLQHTQAYCSPSDETDIENNSTTAPLLWHQSRSRFPLSRHTDKSWSVSSLFECCPMSPSPVCSPFISHVSNPPSHVSNAYSHVSNARSHMSHVNTDDGMFVTAKSSCLVETDPKRSTSSDEIQEEIADEIQEETTFRPPDFNFRQSNRQTPNQLQTPHRHHFDMQNGRARRYLNQGIAPRTVQARYISHQHNVQEAGRPSEARTNSRQLDWPLTTVPSQRSSVGGWNRRSVEGYYLADDENSLTGRPLQLGHSTLARSRGGQIEAQLKALKEERNMKLLTRLRKQEQAIEDWERKQIIKAKEKMRQTELKLELERRTALEKAKKDIEKAQKKAEKRKFQEQNETAKKITRSYKAIENISCVGKLLWKLACF